MRNRRAFFFLASAALCAWPLQAMAQDDGFLLEEAPEKEPIIITTSSVELGLGWVSADSFKFGEYSGLTDESPFGIANIDILRRSPYDGPSTEYWEIYGSNVALDSRSVHLEYGQQGRFSLFLDYSQIPHFAIDDAQTPYIGAGSTNLTLPPACTGGAGTTPPPTPCWDPSQNTPYNSAANMQQLDEDLNPLKIKTERTRYGGGFSVDLNEEWSLGGSFAREDKDGLETVAGIFGSNGGNPRSAILPKPIDYTTQDVDLNLSYHGERLQALFYYRLSLFDDNKHSLTWDNAYKAQASWDASQDFDLGGQGRLALEPDNTAHNAALSLGYTVDPTTRLAGSFAYARMLQDDNFLPYTINGSLAVPFALPRNSLEGDVTKLHGTLSLAKQITPDLDFDAQYTFDDRDNNTPTDVFCVVHNDSVDQDADCPESEDARINRPYSQQQHKLEVDGTYRILSDTKVTLGYDFETIDRDLTEVENTYQHTGSIKLMSAPFSFMSGWIEYAYSDRSGSEYVSNEPFLVSHTDEELATLVGAALFEQNPYLRKFYIADRASHVVKGALTFMPTEDVTVGLGGSFNSSDYYDTLIGLTDQDYASATVDASYMASEDVALSAFFTYDRMTSDQTGYERGGAAIAPGDPLDPNRFWGVDSLDRGYTAGAEVELSLIKDVLGVAVDYTFSRTVTEYDFTFGSAVSGGAGVAPVPDLTSTLHSIGVRGDYTLTEGLILSLGYRFETYDSDDFALDGVGQSVPNVLTLGNQSPDYDAHLVGVSASFRF